jgi:hypothetical protein
MKSPKIIDKTMKTIYKYTLHSQDCTLQLPKGAELLTVQLQNQIPTLWALVNPMTVTEERHICIVGTGWEVEDNMKYITTYMDGYFVWHVFELIK